MIGYSDTNFANDYDTHSHMGFIILVGDNIVSWMCKRIRTVCLSTQESELTGSSEAARELKCMKSLARELKLIEEDDEVI